MGTLPAQTVVHVAKVGNAEFGRARCPSDSEIGEGPMRLDALRIGFTERQDARRQRQP